MQRSQQVETYDVLGNLVSAQAVEYETSVEFDNEERLRAEANDSIASLRSIVNTSGNFSTSAMSNAARTIARALIVLLRLHLRRLDATD